MTMRGRSYRSLSRASVTLIGVMTSAAFSPPHNLSRRHEVEIRGMAFHPSDLMVAVGDTIEWVNRDIVPHSATRPSHWDTGTLKQGQHGIWIVRKGEGGEYACTLHPTMTGKVTIR